MSDRLDYYFRQKVTEAELDAGFDALERADRALQTDKADIGVKQGATVSQHAGGANLTVDISGPGLIYDKLGQRIAWGAVQTVDVSKDENNVSTTVIAAGKEKIVTVFAKFKRSLSDIRTDGNSQSVYFNVAESFDFVVRQGSEGNHPATPVGLDATYVLLADITRSFGVTTVTNANISTARREDAIIVSGTPRSIQSGLTVGAFGQLLGYYNDHVNGVADTHDANDVYNMPASVAWANAEANVGGRLDVVFTALISDLAEVVSPGGTARIGGYILPAVYGGGQQITNGSLRAQLLALKDVLNLDVGSLANWHGGRARTGGRLYDVIVNIASDLGAVAAGSDGAKCIGTEAVGGLTTSSVRAQLSELDAGWGKLDRASSWTATQTLNGQPGGSGSDATDIIPVVKTTLTAHVRHLLWEAPGSSAGKIRFYDAGSGGLEITINAVWGGAAATWSRDNNAFAAMALKVSGSQIRVWNKQAGGAAWADSTVGWDGQWTLSLPTVNQLNFLQANGVSQAAGQIDCFVAFEGVGAAAGNTNVGSGTTFPKLFPSTPSSVTFTILAQSNTPSTPTAFQVEPYGLGVFDDQTVPGSNTYFYTKVTVS